MDNKINIITVILASFEERRRLPFIRKLGRMCKEENLSNKFNQQYPTPRRKLVDYVGLTLKEYFAKAGQKPSLKSSKKDE
jgi:hypothetical protein